MNLQSIDGGDGVPAEPDWQSLYDDELDIQEASEQWGVVMRDMKGAGTLSVANGHAIQRLVEFRVQWKRASRHVAEKGAILAGKRAKVGQWNPYWSVMAQAADKIAALEKALGISSDARSKVSKVQRAKKASRASDGYLGKAGG